MPMGGTTKWSRKRRRKEILLYKELHPLATLIEIGEQFGVTKQYNTRKSKEKKKQ